MLKFLVPNAKGAFNPRKRKEPAPNTNPTKRFKCKECNFAANKKANFVVHMRTNTGEKPYACDFEGCAHRCGHSGGLTTDMRTHTGEKPHACDFEGCGFACTTKIGLAAHKRAHTGDRPFKCDMCEFASTTKSDLIKHKRKHTGERPYSCKFPMCGFASSSSGGLRSHTASMHSSEGKARQKKAERRVELALQKAGYTQLAAGGIKPPRMHFKREMHVDFKCVGDIDGKFARVDFMLTTASGNLVALEVDESQHRFGYGSIGCDMKRMTKIYETLAIEGNSQLTFLRYNPDAYKVAGQTQKIKKADREAFLVEHLEQATRHDQALSIEYAYYNCSGASATMPMICDDPEFNVGLKEAVSRVGHFVTL